MSYVKANFKCEIEVQTFGIFQIYPLTIIPILKSISKLMESPYAQVQSTLDKCYTYKR